MCSLFPSLGGVAKIQRIFDGVVYYADYIHKKKPLKKGAFIYIKTKN
jgi:hypothetical protein